MNAYETQRLKNIKRNQALVEQLGLEHNAAKLSTSRPKSSSTNAKPGKRRKLLTGQPTRTSARIASAGIRPSYAEDELDKSSASAGYQPRRAQSQNPQSARSVSPANTSAKRDPHPDLAAIKAGWTSWTSSAPPPTRDEHGTFHFADAPGFTPNKSPEEILREGCFGGSYFRPLYSKALGTTVEDDWRELPDEWIAGLDVQRYLTSPEYDAEVNKFKVACGQSIEEWEAAGWIAHEYDVRGWFQWFCRFWLGRRCDDDERQIGRWRKCVGETGRWRRILLKKYVAMGVRSVFDEGGDDDAKGDVSPVVHQTCHHWAYEVRQEALDRFWEEGR
ncbi:uncharacterized protein K452DRAFT_283111 [Aplosporella prunicola CBS 121167]|uniref:Uncharacterized protein n=1 Tax=Aplosporella prunicola CBS 121167 TaxID=1176127 RepID=A0A6A6BSY7_9PEZI|nr:uncharacterized protein K452DRAFT_283111 [Aplosporella prunicola CBS 121167]KAF2146908.1 hypothetical protein K452DRAFT_283111 [Aplosporella prunicola CBS 121167]